MQLENGTLATVTGNIHQPGEDLIHSLGFIRMVRTTMTGNNQLRFIVQLFTQTCITGSQVTVARVSLDMTLEIMKE